jgi:hypothetical protein
MELIISQCTKCFEYKPIYEFNKDSRKKHGTTASCKECNNKRRIELYGHEHSVKKAIRYNKIKDTPEFKSKRKEWDSKYKQNNPHVFFLRSLIYNTLKIRKTNRRSNGKYKIMVGYSHNELRDHLESLFSDGMTWENYGKEWGVDHIKPIAKFEIGESPAVINALSNLRPLWKIDNLKKKDKWQN